MSEGRHLAAADAIAVAALEHRVGPVDPRPPVARDRGGSFHRDAGARNNMIRSPQTQTLPNDVPCYEGGSYGDVRPGAWLLGRQRGLAETGAKAAQGGA